MKLSIHYTPKMVADANSYSPSAGKPIQVMASWAELELPLNIVEPAPVSMDQLLLAHDRAYIEGIFSGKIKNGFGNTLSRVTESLPYTSGVMLSAARAALTNQLGAIAPCSGFHHAGYNHAGGYCTFNGLMVTVAVLLAEGRVRKVGILDCDQHWGGRHTGHHRSPASWRSGGALHSLPYLWPSTTGGSLPSDATAIAYGVFRL